ncbi:PFAS [Mytilus edulis]|uniref:PFAS n=1 Tax=Mytilus edulis TaxID=6550 RepID=A0A8S3VC80_MYTED|nr:PFAS [Mytilus edulis]
MPRKEFILERCKPDLKPLTLEVNLTLKDALDRVLRLPSVASKRYLTNKVDRCVTGLVAQQQCVGPLHTPLADVAVTALSYFDKVGSATAIGEQPIKGLIDPACMARMSVGEALTNLVFACITDLKVRSTLDNSDNLFSADLTLLVSVFFFHGFVFIVHC